MNEPLDNNMISGEGNQFQFYRNFLNTEEAEAFTSLLDDHDIPFRMESSGTVIDKAIVGDGLVPKIVVKVLARDFKRVNAIIAQEIGNTRYADINDHYLTQLDNDELMEILEKQEEWTVEDISVAQIILKERGLAVSSEEVRKMRESRFSEIRKGKKGHPLWIIIYGLGIFFGVFLSLLLLIAGLGMSYYYAYGRNSDPDGNRYYVFEQSTRTLGKAMLYGGIVVIVIEMLLFNIAIHDLLSFLG